jgi:hypothetical protein
MKTYLIECSRREQSRTELETDKSYSLVMLPELKKRWLQRRVVPCHVTGIRTRGRH